MDRHALIIGVNLYDNLKGLGTASQEAEELAKILENHGGFRVTRLPRKGDGDGYPVDGNSKLNCETLTTELLLFLENAVDKEALIYFNGHGFSDFTEFNQLKRFKEGQLMVSDSGFKQETNRLIASNALSLIDLNYFISISKVSKLAVFLDCCHAGSTLVKSSIEEALEAIRKDLKFNERYFLLGAYPKDQKVNKGMFTRTIIELLSEDKVRKSNGRITCSDIADSIREKLDSDCKEDQSLIMYSTKRPICLVYYTHKAVEKLFKNANQNPNEQVRSAIYGYKHQLQTFGEKRQEIKYHKKIHELLQQLGSINDILLNLLPTANNSESILESFRRHRYHSTIVEILAYIDGGDAPKNPNGITDTVRMIKADLAKTRSRLEPLYGNNHLVTHAEMSTVIQETITSVSQEIIPRRLHALNTDLQIKFGGLGLLGVVDILRAIAQTVESQSGINEEESKDVNDYLQEIRELNKTLEFILFEHGFYHDYSIELELIVISKIKEPELNQRIIDTYQAAQKINELKKLMTDHLQEKAKSKGLVIQELEKINSFKRMQDLIEEINKAIQEISRVEIEFGIQGQSGAGRLISKQKRLEERRNILQSEYELRQNKLRSLRTKSAVETGVNENFNLKHSIEYEEGELAKLDVKIDQLDIEVDQIKQDLSKQQNLSNFQLFFNREIKKIFKRINYRIDRLLANNDSDFLGKCDELEKKTSPIDFLLQ